MTLTLAEKAERAIRIVRECPKIAFDTETSGLDWTKHNPVGYVITADAIDNYYIPVRHGGGGNLNDPTCAPLTTPEDKITQHYFEGFLAKAFEERRRRGFLTIGHHVKFDMHMSANAGIILGRNCEDTGINEPMLDEHQFSFSLSNCAQRRGVTPKLGDPMYQHISKVLGIPLPKKASEIMEHYWRLSGTDEMAAEYACGDGLTTLHLREAQYPLLIEKDDVGSSMEFIHGVESKLIYTLFRMERRGWKVDEKYVDKLIEAIGSELETAKEKLPKGFNERSGPQTRKVMEAAGVTNWPLTDAGNPSFTEKFLKQSEPGRAVMALRQMSNLLSKFALPLRDRHIWQGHVHAQLNQLKGDDEGTISGRLSCSDPNLQAVTKRNKTLGPRFRRSFLFDEGMRGFEKDYSQCEPRLFAHYSREPSLVDGYNMDPPRDMHAVVAEMFSVERDPTAKRMNMGILTGMQAKTFSEHMEWPLEKAAAAHRQWFNGFPGIKGFQDNAKKLILKRGYVRTICGRRCRLDQARFAYKAVSKIIQGGNADVIKVKLLEIDTYLEEEENDAAHLIMTIHDSMIGQVPEGPEGDRIAANIHSIATKVQCPPYNLRVPFVMDTGWGSNWAVATYGQEHVDKILGAGA